MIRKKTGKRVMIRKKLGSFKNAMQALLDGKKVRYKYWPREHYIVINEKGFLSTENGRDFVIDEYMWRSEKEWETLEEPASYEYEISSMYDGKKVIRISCSLGTHLYKFERFINTGEDDLNAMRCEIYVEKE